MSDKKNYQSFTKVDDVPEIIREYADTLNNIIWSLKEATPGDVEVMVGVRIPGMDNSAMFALTERSMEYFLEELATAAAQRRGSTN